MLCRRCANSAATRRTSMRRPAEAGDASLERVLCAGCGAVLPADALREPLLVKLSQLARCGLAGDGIPLLRVVPRTSEGD